MLLYQVSLWTDQKAINAIDLDGATSPTFIVKFYLFEINTMTIISILYLYMFEYYIYWHILFSLEKKK